MKLVERILYQIKAASPRLSRETVGTFTADLNDLNDVARRHKKYVQRFLRLKLPRDKRRLEKLLAQIEVNATEGLWHSRSMVRNMPKLWNAISPNESSNATRKAKKLRVGNRRSRGMKGTGGLE